jgi:hypothetical protein
MLSIKTRTDKTQSKFILAFNLFHSIAPEPERRGPPRPSDT